MFCMKCGAELPEGAKFCVRCGNSVAGNPAAEKRVTVNPAMENSAAENPAIENSGAENPATEIPVGESAPANNSIVENAAANIAMAGNVVQEKLETIKPVIGEMGKKLGATAGPAIGEMGKKLEATAGPAIGAIENKLNVKLDKKKLGIIGAVVVVFILVLLLKGGGKGSGSGFSSPEEAYDAWMTGFCLYDFDLTIQAEPDFVIEYEGGEDRLRETLERNYNNDIATSPHAGNFKFEAVGSTMVEKDELEKFEQEMRNFYGDDVKISAAAVIQHRLVDLADDSSSDEGATGTSAYAFKYKGKWYYMNTGRM